MQGSAAPPSPAPSPPVTHPALIDPAAAARWARLPPVRDAANRPVSAWLHEEVARRMGQRLPWIRLQPSAWAHWWPDRSGMDADAQVAQLYPAAQRLWCLRHDFPSDIALKKIANAVPPPTWRPGWLAAAWQRWRGAAAGASRWAAAANSFADTIAADAAQAATLPAPPAVLSLPPDGSVQMVWANMLLHSAADWPTLLAQWQRALAVDGFLMFSCLGPDTLRELRALYAAQGWPPPMHPLTDMHDWGDRLAQAGFAEPVMDMERIQLSFDTPARLLRELRELGRNLHPQRFAGLRGRRWLAQLHQALHQLARPEEDGRLVISFEIIYGHAIKAAPRPPVQPETHIPLEALRQSLRRDKRQPLLKDPP